MSTLTRRGFLRGTAIAAGAASLPLSMLLSRSAKAQTMPFGPLETDPRGILDLPAGFSYRILETAGDTMDDGLSVPGGPDGMAAIALGGGQLALMRNHELSMSGGPGGGPFSETYRTGDGFQGGVTRLVVNEADYSRVSSNLVLHGTARNCAGGPTPDAWLSCEENTTAGHGFVFRCPADASSISAPQRIDGYGRFNHEAVAFDPTTGVAYLTEDRGNGCLYRFVPDDPSDPFGAGTLSALRVVGMDALVLAGERRGVTWDIDWVPLTDPSSPGDTLRGEAQAMGAAIFDRGEGIDFDGSDVYVCTTRGGPADRGQIFVLDPSASTLRILGESPAGATLDSPDNIVVAPWGDVIMAEDPSGTPYIRGMDADGDIYDFARNTLSASEFAGVCFSPRGDALFVNIQRDGLTLVITGPFPDPPEPPADGGVVGADAGPAPDGGGLPEVDASAIRDAGGGPGSGEGDGCGCSTPGAPARSGLGAGLVLGAAAIGVTAARSGRSEPGEAE